MFFNSVDYLVFLPFVFLLYWIVFNRSLQVQNLFLLVASYFFYGCWDYRFLSLLMFSTLLDYFSGLQISRSQKVRQKKFWLVLSLTINIGFLAVFKYFDFFVLSFAKAFADFGIILNPTTLNIILPIGISFYTFHGISYIVDVYYGRIDSEKDFFSYAVFVSFFPLLVAGPIERATHLLPQIKTPRILTYEKGVSGLRQILWGLFKKIVIADNCAVIVNGIYSDPENASGSALAMGTFLFAIQIYCDFSGYSDIALGTARLLGIELLRNFAFPYFSRDIAEFWRRWHISLTSWFRDYVYIPLGGSRGSVWSKICNTSIVFLLSGLWHGANWTFVIWGLLNAIYFLPLLLSGSNRLNLDTVAQGRLFPSVKETLQMLLTFMLVSLAWIFFRAENVSQSFQILSRIFSSSLLTLPPKIPYLLLLVVGILFTIEWLGRFHQFAIEYFSVRFNWVVRWSFYYALIVLIFIFGGRTQEFIYFQF